MTEFYCGKKSFQIEWKDGNLVGAYQIPPQEEGEIEVKTRLHPWDNASTYQKIIVVINARNKQAAIRKFTEKYGVKLKSHC